MADDLSPLTKPDHYLGWLGDDPARAVRDEIERMLRRQVPAATLRWLRLRGEPYFLTGGRKLPDDPDRLILTRAALAVSFELEVDAAGETKQLSGVFSWAAAGLDAERRDRTYLDLNAELGWGAQELKLRIYELDAEDVAPPAETKRRWWEFWRKDDEAPDRNSL